jgi:hypothetical protein
MARVGQTRSGLVEDVLVVAAGMAIVFLSVRGRRGGGSRQIVGVEGGGDSEISAT